MSSKVLALLCLFVALAAAAPQAGRQAAVADICLSPPIADGAAACNDYSIRYYYDARTGDCEDFLYTGCGATENHFLTEFDCEVRCEEPHDRLNSFESVDRLNSFESVESVETYRYGK